VTLPQSIVAGTSSERAPWASVSIACSCLGAAVAVWLAPASIQIVNWTAQPARVALVAPLSTLWLTLGLGVALAAGALFAGATARLGRPRRARILSPLSLLWLWTIPYWPWLPDRAPGLLILAGPARWIVAALAAGGVLAELASQGNGFSLRPRRGTMFLATLALYIGLGLRSYATIGLGGDEPHYLVITHSLLVDRDFKIENNHTNRDYRGFFGGDLRPDYMRRGQNGAIYSIHAPGLPVLLVPGYAIAGARGAIITMCVFGALAALAVYDVALIVGGAAAALWTWIAVCLTVPFLPHGWMLYPETAGAPIVAWAVLWLIGPPSARASAWIWRGGCLAMLPWLHTKFVVFLAILALCLAWRIRGRIKDLVAFAMPIAVSSAAWLGFFYVVYGSLDPQAPYGNYTAQFVQFVNVPRSLLGTFLDQKFGLFVYSPIYLASVIGLLLMLRDARMRVVAVALTVTVIPYVISSARLYMWWGGSSAPARFLVPTLPLIAPALAAAFAQIRGAVARPTMMLWLALSVGIAAVGVGFPERGFLFSTPHGVARLLEVSEGSAPISATLPTFTEENWTDPAGRALPWAIAAAVALGVAAVLIRRTPSIGGYWVAATETTAFIVTASVMTAPGSPIVRAESARRGQLEIMDAYDPGRLRAFDYRSATRLDSAGLLRASTLSVARSPEEQIDPQRRVAGPFGVPAGRYVARVWFGGSQPRDGDVVIAPRRGSPFARLPGPLNNPATVAFEMPAQVPFWLSLSEASTAQAVQRVEIEPIEIVPRSERVTASIRAVEAVEDRPNAYILYMNEETYPEGGVFWTRAGNRGDVLVAPAGASEILLTLHVGPTAGTVKVSVAGRNLDVEMSANETREVKAPVPAGARLVSINVQAPGWFRPAQADPKSTDTRSLGCQVRINLR
jgi:hypothetical protein